MEGVRGFFTSKLTFIDNLTNGKLSSIKNKFVNGLEGALGTVNSKMESIKNKFNEKMTAAGNLVNAGIQAMKNLFNIDFPIPRITLPHLSVSGSFSLKPPSVPSFSINWYADGGIMTAPTIFGAAGGSLLGGGEAGDEAILPLSVLWEKMGKFIQNALKGDGEKNRPNIQGVFRELVKKETRTIEKREKNSSETSTHFEHGKDKKTIIQKLDIKVDISKLKDLPMLFKLVDELKDDQNSTEDA